MLEQPLFPVHLAVKSDEPFEAEPGCNCQEAPLVSNGSQCRLQFVPVDERLSGDCILWHATEYKS